MNLILKLNQYQQRKKLKILKFSRKNPNKFNIMFGDHSRDETNKQVRILAL